MRILYAFPIKLQLLQNNNTAKHLLHSKVTRAVTFFCILVTVLQAQETLFEFTAGKYLLGTKIDITAVGSSVDSMKRAMYYSFMEIERIQGVLSMQIDSSEISAINRNAGKRSVKVSYETYSLIERSIEYSKLYPCFDITIGPVSELWGFNSDSPVTTIPDKRTIDSLLKFVGFEKVILNDEDTSIFLKLEGMKLDPGGIAKGYAVDKAVYLMRLHGIRNFIINAGGDIFVSGKKSESEKWRVGIKHPRKEYEITALLVLPRDGAVGTSGDYERYTIIDGVRYHHIFDVKTGYPVLKTQSATSFAQTVEEAVVLSKYLFISAGDSISLSVNKIPAVVIDSSGSVNYDKEAMNPYSLVFVK